MPDNNNISLETALDLHNMGLNLVPIRTAKEVKNDGTVSGGKDPAVSWKCWATERQPEEWVRRTFADGSRTARPAIAIVTGAGSGGLVVFDFDQNGRSFDPWCAKLPPELLGKLVIECSRSGSGRHVYFRMAGEPLGTVVLAGTADHKSKPLIETRGQGGYIICTPSPGQRLLQGTFEQIPTLTAAEVEALSEAARSLDERPAEASDRGLLTLDQSAWRSTCLPLRPGDLYNEQGNDHFAAMLTERGWKYVGGTLTDQRWLRPGKESGNSATLRFVEDDKHEPKHWEGKRWWFRVFSSSTGLDEKAYSLFEYYTKAVCGGDFRAAARQLAEAGFRSEEEEPEVPPEMGQTLTLDTAESDLIVRTVEAAKDEGAGPSKDVTDATDPAILPFTGLIGEIVEYTHKTSPRHSPVLAWTGAVAFMSMLAGRRRCHTRFGDRPNLYLLSAAASGGGKSFPQQVCRTLAHALVLDGAVTGNVGSGPGLEDTLAYAPNATLLDIEDEAHLFFQTTRAKDNALALGIARMLLQLFSESGGMHELRRLSQRGQNNPRSAPRVLEQPHLTLLASGIPSFIGQAISEDAMTNGLLGRLPLFVSERGARNDNSVAELPPFDLIVRLRRLSDSPPFFGQYTASPRPDGPVVEVDEEATALRKALLDEADRLHTRASGELAEAKRTVYARLVEQAMRLALVLSVSEKPEQPVITAPLLQSAWDVVSDATDRLLRLVQTYAAANPHDELCKKALRIIREQRGNPTARSALLRSLHISAREFDEVVSTLVESHQACKIIKPTAGRPGEYYGVPEFQSSRVQATEQLSS